jgi:glutamate-1-semialdehyde 2,1-aminomutase
VDGNEYIDYLLGSGPLVLGHAHPAVVEAVQAQAALGSTFWAPTEPILELAEVIVRQVPCAQMVQFCTSGSEATLYAMRLARAATGRDLVLKFEGGFHGSNDYALISLWPSAQSAFPLGEPASAGIPQAIVGQMLIAPYNDLATTTAIIEAQAGRVSAILVEPMQRVISPRAGFLQGLRELATRHGAALIFDEVVTGFRLGPGGAQQYYGVTPDLACLGKIIGGGYPLAAVAGRRDILELADPSRRGSDPYVYFSGTLNGNPIAAAAGLATIGVLNQPGSYERLHELGERARAGLRAAFADSGRPAQVLGEGPLFQALLTASDVVDYRTMKTADAASMKSIAREVFGRGYFLSGDKAYLSLVHSDDDVDGLVKAFREALEP